MATNTHRRAPAAAPAAPSRPPTTSADRPDRTAQADATGQRRAAPEQRSSASPAAPPVGVVEPDRGHVIHARHQWFAFAAFGTLCCLAAPIFATWRPTASDGRWFWVVVGPIVGAVAMFRSQARFGDEGADRDAAPYVGVLVGTTVGAVVVGWLGLDGWVLPGVFTLVAAFLAFMAWLEQSAVGMTTALTMTVLAACTAVADLDRSAVTLSLCLGLMLLAGAAALTVATGEEEPVG